MRPVLIAQIVILCVSVAAIFNWFDRFPYPGVVTKPFLEGKHKWPEPVVKDMVDNHIYDEGFLKFFNRDPDRITPENGDFISPADGVVKYITKIDGMTYFVVGLSFWDVHVLRSPVDGIVKNIERRGISIYRDRSETERMEDGNLIFLDEKQMPVQLLITIETPKGDVTMRLITSYWASRLSTWVAVGEKLKRGQRVGKIQLGSSATVDIPYDVEFSVETGERLIAGESIIVEEAGF